MIGDFLKKNIASQVNADPANPGYVAYGYGQVEPNHLSAQATKEVYAQLPADKNIAILENGQFAKYDYANGLVNFTGAGEWMLVFNEIKLYRDGQSDCEFAMIKDNYQARVYSPYLDGSEADKQARFYNGNGVDAADGSITFANGQVTVDGKSFPIDDVTAAPDIYEPHYNEDPFHFLGRYKEAMMPVGTTMVPRLLKTNIGDIFTTNMIAEAPKSLAVDDRLFVGDDGILSKTKGSNSGDMEWQVVKVYTMPDGQPGVKLMRIK